MLLYFTSATEKCVFLTIFIYYIQAAKFRNTFK